MTASGVLIPSLQIDADIVGANHCYDAWREAVRAVYDVNPSTDEKSSSESVKAWLLKELIFSKVSFSAQAFRHDSRLARDSNFLSLQLYRKGGCVGVLDDLSWKIVPGDIHIFDFSREFYSTTADSSVVGVVIPHEYIGYDPAKHPGHMMFSGSSPIGQFLANTLFALLDQLPEVDKSESQDLANGFCSLLRGVLKPQLPQQEKELKDREERRKEMRSYLDRNLSDPNLSVDHLCKIFNISRPSVYRDFAESGGVANYIMQRRLKRAYFQLASVPEGHRRIKEVAHGVGFNDAAHFSRLFRRRFGITPKEAANLRSAERLIGTPTSKADDLINFGQLSEWIQGI